MKKILARLIMLIVVFALSTSVYAFDEEVIRDSNEAENVEENAIVISPMAEPCVYGKILSVRTKSTKNVATFNHTAASQPVATTVTHSVTVRRFTTTTLATNAEVNFIAGKLGASVQVGMGVDTSVTNSVSWSIPANTSMRLTAGYRVMESTVNQYYEYTDCSKSATQVKSLNYSYESYHTSTKN